MNDKVAVAESKNHSNIYMIFCLLLLFFYLYPVYFKFFPLPTDRILQAFGLGLIGLKLFFFQKFSINRKLFIILCTSAFMAFLSFLSIQQAKYADSYLIKWFFNIVLNCLSAYFIIWYIDSKVVRVTIGRLLDFVIYVGLIQACISFYFFFNPSQYSLFTSLLKADVVEGVTNRLGLLQIRLMGIGNTFFGAVITYSVDLLILSTLPYITGSRIYKNKWMYWSSITIIAIAGILSGRTFFITIFITIILVIYNERRRLIELTRSSAKVIFIISILGMFLVIPFQSLLDINRLERVWDFAFELFINYSDSGSLDTNSSQKMADMIRLPSKLSTWLVGDGMILEMDGSYYKHIDLGFIRLLYYFGIFGIFAFLVAQIIYFKILSSFFRKKEAKMFCLFLFFLVVMLNMKGLANIDNYVILFIIAGIWERNKERNIATQSLSK